MTGTEPEKTEPAWEYYDLSIDPQETLNRYNDPAYAERISLLTSRLHQLKTEAGDHR